MTTRWLQFGTAMAGALLVAACGGQPQFPHDTADADFVHAQPAGTGKGERPKDPASAADYYGNLYANDPTNLAAAIGMLQNLREMGSFDQARETATKLLAGKPDQPKLLAEFGKIELASGRFKEAVQQLQRSIGFDGSDWTAHSALGIAYDRLGEYEHADASYQAALAISPGNPAVLSNLALSKAMAGDLKAAQALLQQASTGGGADARVRQNYALVSALGGDLVRAEELTRKDLPPELAQDTIAYYRELAAGASSK
jgi:Flp pilus assembly protein TadD